VTVVSISIRADSAAETISVYEVCRLYSSVRRRKYLTRRCSRRSHAPNLMTHRSQWLSSRCSSRSTGQRLRSSTATKSCCSLTRC